MSPIRTCSTGTVTSRPSRTSEAVFGAINGDTSATKISGGKIDASSITIGKSQVDGLDDAIADATGLSYDCGWSYDPTTGVYTFAGHAFRGGVEITDSLEPEFFKWFRRDEDGYTQLSYGKVISVAASTAGYRASIIGALEESAEFALADASGTALVDASGAAITAYKVL
jgi:hypothetical protein